MAKVIKQREKFPKCIWKGDLLISMNILPVFTYRGGGKRGSGETKTNKQWCEVYKGI